MKASKSFNGLAGQQPPQQDYQNQISPRTNGLAQMQQQTSNNTPTSPICRCRVMYLGSSVPHITKDGLQGIQEPLRELYPDKATLDQGNAGIDSWLSVWSNGILIENVDETGREVKRFFKIEALHYCAAVKFVAQIAANQTLPSNHNSLTGLPKFLPLDSVHARMQQNNTHPPIFASILRRTTGVKVLECHAFICKREAAANALVRCCFHAYADTMYAKQIGAEIDNIGLPNNNTGLIADTHPSVPVRQNGAPAITARRSKSIAALNEAENETSSDSSNRNDFQKQHYSNSVSRRKSLNNGSHMQNGDLSDANLNHHQTIYNNQNNLQKQHNFSKSMHHLNQPELAFGRFEDSVDGSLHSNQSSSIHNLSSKRMQKHQRNGEPAVPEPFFNPYSSRVPSYPPQSIIDQQHTAGGTLRSVKSVAANSIASTLLRSKKHAKAMSMAQLNQSNPQLNQFNNDRITSFHQPHNLHQQQLATMGPGSFLTMPPVPPMFLPNIQRLPQMSGSQTMKLPGRHNPHSMIGLGSIPQINFEAMTPKEIKKLLKKSAKYGLDPSRITENGLPLLPLRPVPIPMQMQTAPAMVPPHMMPPPPPASNKSDTLGSQSLYSTDLHNDVTDYSSQTLAYRAAGLALSPNLESPHQGPMQPIKSILVKPNPEFLKSKAGKKWLKQQKEFKKLLPPHLDGLPIVFGPPPLDALEPAELPAGNGALQPPPQFLQPPPPTMPAPPLTSAMGLPMMDANGYYNPHPFYGPSGRASAASTLLRYSPHSQLIHQQQQIHENGLMNGNHSQQIDFMPQSQAQAMYTDPALLINQQHHSQSALMMNQPNGTEPMYSNNLEKFDRQYPFGSERMTTNHLRHNQLHNLMVEQSVISLGDENDGDDDGYEFQRDDEEDDNQADGYYDRVGSTSSRSTGQQPRSLRHHQHGSSQGRSNANQRAGIHSETNKQQQQANDDHSSHSSGIYRRKHINERAFSYSIRQEHKSNGGGNTSNSDGDCLTDNGGDYSDSPQNYHHRVPYDNNNNSNKNYRANQAQQTYDNPQSIQPGIYQTRSQLNYARNALQQQHPPPPPPPVDMELSSRLEQQLSMKSFANSGVKSHM